MIPKPPRSGALLGLRPFGRPFPDEAQQPKQPMTICAAVICRHTHSERDGQLRPSVMTISDRMLSSVDIEFEPEQTKIKKLASSIVAMYSGERDFHHTISEAVVRQLGENATVEEAAERYAFHYLQLRRNRASAKHLAMIGLDYESFVSRLAERDSSTLADIYHRILEERLGLHAIVAGTDRDGAHIYTVGRDEECVVPWCHDERGFVAIGTGFRQFETEFMRQGYTSRSGSLDALWLMMTAKLRAQASPGVGTKTDAALIAERLGYWRKEDMDQLEAGVKELDERTKKIADEIKHRLSKDDQPKEPS